MIATILSLALAGFMFKLVFNAFRDGEAWVKGESGSWFAEKEKNPVLFYFTVTGFFSVGVIGLGLAYKNITGSFPDISIHEAAARGNIEAVKQHLAAGTDVNAKSANKRGWTSLHFAAGLGRKETAELLTAEGADVNAKGDEGRTPLHHVARSGHKGIFELLIAKGADVNAKSVFGTPLDQAQVMIPASPPEIKAARKEIADLLRKHGGKTRRELKAEAE